MAKFKVGDEVKRKEDDYSEAWLDGCREGRFSPNDVMVVEKVSVSGSLITLRGVTGAWVAESFELFHKKEDSCDMVMNPKHYEFFEGVEAITIIARSMTEKQFAGYCMGNALKYRLRAGKKLNTEEDLKKADYYKDLFQKHRHECIDEDL
ncbi:hypothetical protein UAB78_031 [Escherichia phage UAB_Phi78]|uniref:Nucleotide kinase n=1 Tax=Escherichia phage UAB_Phi78 TaxID=979726 RepID=A0A9K0IGB8_9CAUD|nr:nucleotide kinase [Escherichia phage UAB_Phi78]ADW95235.1 hypothetical protein UAB78_031 [Escherichia phage UAB_Phi78]